MCRLMTDALPRKHSEPSEPEFLTVPEVATLLRVDPATVRRWCASQTLAASKPGRDYRIPRTAVAELLGRRRTPLADSATRDRPAGSGPLTRA